MLALLGEGSTASSVLARRLAVSPPSVTAVVDGLVGRGLVERQADPEDRRRLTLLLTRDGAKLLAAADAAAEARLDEIAGFFDERADRPRARAGTSRSTATAKRALEQRQVTIEMGAFGADVTSPFVPVGVTAAATRHRPREATRSATKVAGRAPRGSGACMPIVLAHKWMFGFSLLASFIGLAVQVQIPNEVGQAIDALGEDDRHVARALRRRSSWCSP